MKYGVYGLVVWSNSGELVAWFDSWIEICPFI